MPYSFRLSLVMAISIGFASFLKAQSFTPVPAPLLSAEVLPGAANEVYLYFQNNAFADSIHLRWRRLEVTAPQGWIIDICDYGTCYIGIPAQGAMYPAPVSDQPYLKLIVQPGAEPGNAWLAFRVVNVNDPADFVDVFFSLATPGVTSVAPLGNEAPFRVFPNPANGAFFLAGHADRPAPVNVFSAAGHLQWSGVLQPGHMQEINTTNWPQGLYQVKTPLGNRWIMILN